jgi:hypothetical protein
MAERTAGLRGAKLARPEEVKGASFGIDWYNVLITVESYLRGALLFIADDGMLRDSSAVHGNYGKSAITETALSEIVRSLRLLEPLRVDVFLDSPISHSGHMAEDIRGRLAGIAGLSSEVSLVHSADFPLKSYAGVVASSDSIVLDAARRVFDLPRFTLLERFAFNPPHLLELGRQALEGPFRLLESESPAP